MGEAGFVHPLIATASPTLLLALFVFGIPAISDNLRRPREAS